MTDPVVPAKAPRPTRPAWATFGHDGFHQDWEHGRRVVITLAVIGLAYFLWLISDILLLIFAAILLAVLLSFLADLMTRYTPVPQRWSLTVTVVLAAVLVVGFLGMFGAQIGGQITQVVEKLPQAINAAGARLDISNASAQLEEAIASSSGSLLSRLAGLGSTVIGALANLALVVVAAIYLAADPTLYRRGAIQLLPRSQHDRILDAMNVSGNALRLWFAGQLVAMTLVGVVSGLAYWWIGLPSPLALGLIAGATNFVPYLGPILGAIPAMVFALATDLNTALWTLGAVVAIQQLEGNVITPFIQQRAVSLPPAVVLFAIVVFGLVFGLPGVFLAVPLTVTLMVLVKKLWVRQMLGEETAVPGEEDDTSGRMLDPTTRRT
ncbi:AI-2E family transporter [Microvirga aerophila]|uniref:AI-2E family transporter n=1 Tax=Microvirga aerophila TaxID=670291 RepID=UPI0013B4443E|nr:AI-2E family transporter [Microvirga aerophila]